MHELYCLLRSRLNPPKPTAGVGEKGYSEKGYRELGI